MQDAPGWSLFHFVRGWAAKNLASNLNSTTRGCKQAGRNLAIARKTCYFFLQVRQPVTDRSTEKKALRRIRTHGEGWAFSARDFADLGSRLEAQESANATRFAQVETRLDEHASKLADIPSTSQIVAAMEQLLSKTMTSLDERLTTQAHSIEALKTTATQTDSLLERVLESLDSLESYTEPAELAGVSVAQRAVV